MDKDEASQRRNMELLACALMGLLVLVSMIPVLLDLRWLTDGMLYSLYSLLRWLPVVYIGLLVLLLRVARDVRQRWIAVGGVGLLFLGSPGRLGSFASLTLAPMGLVLLASTLARSAPAWHPKGLKSPFSVTRLAAIFLLIIFVLAVGFEYFGLRYEQFTYFKMIRIFYFAYLAISLSFGAGLLRHVSHLLGNTPREVEEELSSSSAF